MNGVTLALQYRFSNLESSHEKLLERLKVVPKYEKTEKEQFNFEAMTELFDKIADGLDVRKEHQRDKIPAGIRLKLESKLYLRMDEALKDPGESDRKIHCWLRRFKGK